MAMAWSAAKRGVSITPRVSCPLPQGAKLRSLLGGQGAWRSVHDAEHADLRRVERRERLPRVEADVRLAQDERVVGKTRVLTRVRNDEDVVAVDRVGAER